jgi:hypothetical protein
VVAPLFVLPFGDWESGGVRSDGGVALPELPAPGEALPGCDVLFGDCVEGLLALGLVVPELGAAVPGRGAAVPGVGAAVPAGGAALPGFVLVVPGEFDWPGVALWPAVPAWPPADPVLPEPAVCATTQVPESNTRDRTVVFTFM